MRRAVGDAVRSLAGTRRIALALPLADDDALLTVSIAALMGAYDYVSFRSASKKDRKAPVQSITVLLPAAPTPEQKHAVKEVSAVASAVNLTRDLVNTPPNALPPSALAAAAVLAVDGLPVDVTIWDELDLLRDGCGGILAVGQGSANAASARAAGVRARGGDAPPGPRRQGHHVRHRRHLHQAGRQHGRDEVRHGRRGRGPRRRPGDRRARPADPRDRLGPVRREHAERHRPAPRRRHHDRTAATTVEVLNTDAEGRLVLADALGPGGRGQARRDHRHRHAHRRARSSPSAPGSPGSWATTTTPATRSATRRPRPARPCGRCRSPTTCGRRWTRPRPTSPTSASATAGC